MTSLFTKIINRDIPSDIVYEDDSFIIIKDIKPEKRTHLLIIPKKEIISINEISSEDKNLMGDMLLLAKNISKQIGVESSYQLRINNGDLQEIKHIHMHLLSDL